MSRFSMAGRVCGRSEVGAVRLASRGPEPTAAPLAPAVVPGTVAAPVAARPDADRPDADRPDVVRNAVRPWLIPGGSGSPLGGPRQPCVTMVGDACTLEVRNVGNGLAFIEPEKCYLSLGSRRFSAGHVARRALPVNEEGSIAFPLAAAPDGPRRDGIDVEIYYTDMWHSHDVSAHFAIVRADTTGEWTVTEVVYRHPDADEPFGTIHFSR
jgi:hypothetical protein